MGYTRRLLALLAMACAASGCVRVAFTEPVTSFQDSVNTSAAAISTYYTELNRFERELYLNERVFDSAKRVEDTDSTGRRTPLLHSSFSPESIKARTDAIALLGVYAKRLGELAGSEAPTTFSQNASALGTNLASLQKTFATLSGSDAKAADYVGPIGTIVGVIGQMFMEQHRDRALKEAIDTGAPAVRKVLDLLEADLVQVIDPVRASGMKQALTDQVVAYNAEVDRVALGRTPWPMDDRRKRLEDIRAAAERYETAVAASPTELIQGMREAHAALVTFAKSSRMPQDLSELTTVLEAFRNRAKTVSDAIKELQELKKEARR